MVINIVEPINFQVHNDQESSARESEDQKRFRLNLSNLETLNELVAQKQDSSRNHYSYLFKAKEKKDASVQSSRRNNSDPTTKVKKKRTVTICATSCKYDVVKRVAAQIGMKEVSEDGSWNLCWTDAMLGMERIKDMKRFQKINHFPGMNEICRKDFLARNLKRMMKLFPKDYNFFPKTWCLPSDLGDALEFAKNKKKIYILKPYAGSQGRGIFLTKNLKDLRISERMICQLYIARPYIIDGFKFDLRVYALITSCDPLRIYVYNEGLARFATNKYKIVNDANMLDVYMHLTNYTVNKNSDTFDENEESGSKRAFSTLNKWWRDNDVNVAGLWSKIDEIIVKTIVTAFPTLRHSYNACFPNHDLIYACFELLGFDILLDWKLKPYLLEVNHSPSLHTDSKVDKRIKEVLLLDTFEILNLLQYNKKKIMEEDKKRVIDRLRHGNHKDLSVNDASSVLTKIDRSDAIQKQFQWEDAHLGNFRRVYPAEDADKYTPFFNQNAASVLQETVASKAREEALKLQREEYDLKIKEEESKRLNGKGNDPKISSESLSPCSKIKTAQTKNKAHLKKPLTNRSQNMSNRYPYNMEPELISEEEEKERKSAMSERAVLLNSLNMLNIIYMSLKENQILSPKDKSKYGPFFEPKKAEPKPKLPEKRKVYRPPYKRK